MSTIYDKTENYALNLYGDNDPADLRDGYNGSMRTIDTTLETHLNRIEGVEARETHDEAVMKALLVDNTVDDATAAKAKWDKAGTDAIAANDKAEAVDRKADANTTLITALRTDVDKLKHKKNIAVFVGDSITNGTGASSWQKRYSTLFCDMAGLIEKNYSWPGAGWIHSQSTGGGSTIPQLASKAVDDTTYNHDDVALVVVACGINDNNANDISALVQSNLLALQNSFPNARYVELVCPTFGTMSGVQSTTPTTGGTLTGKAFGVAGMYNIISTMTGQAASYTKFTPIPAWYLFSFAKNVSSLSQDGLHPNDSGHRMMANMLLGIYQGNGIVIDNGSNYTEITPIGLSASDGLDKMVEIFTRNNKAPSHFTFSEFKTNLFNRIKVQCTPSMSSMSANIRVRVNFTTAAFDGSETAYIPLHEKPYTPLRTGIFDLAKRSSINSAMFLVGWGKGKKTDDHTSISDVPVWVQYDRMTGYYTLVIGEIMPNATYTVDVYANGSLTFPTIKNYVYAG